MTVVAGRNRVNRPYFFTDVNGERVELPSFGTGQGDLEGAQLAEFRMYENVGQIAATVAQTAPANTAVPTITGTATVGGTLTSTTGTWSGDPAPTFTRQWQRGTTNISGATGATYTPVVADAGQTIRVVITATNAQGSSTANSAATVAVTRSPSNTAVPAITGTAQVGATLTTTNGTWAATPTATYARVWQRSANGTSGWAAIAGATATTYVLAAADDGQYIRTVVTATNSAGNATANSAAVGPVIPAA